MTDTLLLSLIVFVPVVAAVVLMVIPGKLAELIKWISLASTVVVLVLSLMLWGAYRNLDPQLESGEDSTLAARASQSLLSTNRDAVPGTLRPDTISDDLVFRYAWINVFNVEYYMGVDGINLPLVLLTGLISVLSMIASWGITKNIKGYCILFLLLETGMMGTFLSLDFFLFYVFWEVMLLPMYFLIALWGAPSRVEPDGRVRGGPYAAIKFFLYTLFGSVLMLLAMLALYFYPIAETSNVSAQQSQAALDSDEATPEPGQEEPGEAAAPAGGTGGAMAGVGAVGGVVPETFVNSKPAYSFDIMKLHGWGMGGAYTLTFQIVMFVLLYIGFAIKVPLFPFHTWLPDAHVEAPTPISMILAGVLLKMGGYGLIRIAYPICPAAALTLAWPLAIIAVTNILYGAFAAMAQTDFKKLVAYSSVSHMGYVMLGFAVWSMAGDADIWAMGMNGAMFQMLGHGISSAGMFFVVGVIYDRLHHRDLNRFGGLANEMPLYGGVAAVLFFAGLGLPGLCGFIGEVMTVLASWQFSRVIAALAALGVILTAGYILWTLQRVFMGSRKEKDEHPLREITWRELSCAVPLVILAVVLGVYPRIVFDFMEPSVTALVHNLSDYTRETASTVTEIIRR